MTPTELLKAMFGAAVAAALTSTLRSRPPARAAQGPHHRARRRQGGRRDGEGGRGALGRARSRAWSSRATATACRCQRIEVVEAAHPVPDAAGRDAARRILDWSQGLSRGRSRALPDLRRRLGAARAAAPRADARRQAGGQQGAAQVRRHHRRDELRAQAPVGDQGRAARRRGASGARW